MGERGQVRCSIKVYKCNGAKGMERELGTVFVVL